MSQTSPGVRDYAMLVTLSAIWGSSFLFMKIGVETVPAATLTLGRLAIAAVLLVWVARLAGQHLPRGARLWGLIALAALFGSALPFTLIAWGEERIDSGLAAILMAFMPLTTVLLAHIFTEDEKMTPRKALGVVLGIVGLVVLIGPETLTQLGDDSLRQLAVAGAAFCYGINAIVAKALSRLPRRAAPWPPRSCWSRPRCCCRLVCFWTGPGLLPRVWSHLPPSLSWVSCRPPSEPYSCWPFCAVRERRSSPSSISWRLYSA